MLEKILLAVTITFSLNLFLQVRPSDQPQTKTNTQIVVTMQK
ncbi:hypothetical protein [Iningainema tapete]|nr:hypothetical protein [Iningainema tapete]